MDHTSPIDWPAFLDWSPLGHRPADPEFETSLLANNANLAPAQQAYHPLGTVAATLLESPSPPASPDVTETDRPRLENQDDEGLQTARAKIGQLESCVVPTFLPDGWPTP